MRRSHSVLNPFPTAEAPLDAESQGADAGGGLGFFFSFACWFKPFGGADLCRWRMSSEF